jgi:hypothetical protein
MRWLPLLLLPGCTAIKAAYSLVDAQRAFREAEDAGADVRAVYQYTLAEEYLKKAREEDGYSDYGAVDKLCRKAKEASALAVEDATSGGVGPDAEELPEDLLSAPDPEREPEGDFEEEA